MSEKRIEDLFLQLQLTIEDLEDLQRAVSHDLRAPLRAVKGFCNILKEDYSDKLDTEAKRLIEIITANADQVNRLIDDLINFSRISNRHLSIQEVDMNELVKNSINQLLSSEERKLFTMKIDELGHCQGDKILLQEVWIQLLKNAIQFSWKKEKSSIEIRYQPDDNFNVYVVKDTGIGFDMEYSNRLFKVLQRIHIQKGFEGTGTGLALVKRIILKHKGDLWAESVKDHGSSFYFSIPKNNRLMAL